MPPSVSVWQCCGCRSTADTGAFSVDSLPPSPFHPLHLRCTSCSLRTVVCECCQALVDTEKEVDGVLLCKRCGFLTVLDASLRRRVQLAPFSRQILTAMVEQQQQQLSFSTTHLHILRSMYEKTMEKDDLPATIEAIEQFLLHQSTILSAKFDLLSPPLAT
ncbi:hypothetical protein ATCC90586_008823 [Pythium insidiosum]|nr:hypothetical protein ATCC90586_008823 [Pythium insidiosum]